MNVSTTLTSLLFSTDQSLYIEHRRINFHNTEKGRGVGGGEKGEGGGEVEKKAEEKEARQQANKTSTHSTTSDSTRIDAKFSEMKACTYSTFSILVSETWANSSFGIKEKISLQDLISPCSEFLWPSY